MLDDFLTLAKLPPVLGRLPHLQVTHQKCTQYQGGGYTQVTCQNQLTWPMHARVSSTLNSMGGALHVLTDNLYTVCEPCTCLHTHEYMCTMHVCILANGGTSAHLLRHFWLISNRLYLGLLRLNSCNLLSNYLFTLSAFCLLG